MPARQIAASLLLALAASATSHANEPPPAQIASPAIYSVLEENNHVLVLKMTLAPGQSDAVHRHHNETVYFQQGGRLRITQADGESLEITVADGQVMWHPAWTHQVSNIGENTVVAIIVEDKPERTTQ